MSLFRELIHTIRFFWMTPREEKRIIFYAEHEGYYPNFEGIINELSDTYDGIICYITSDKRDSVLQRSSPKIKAFYIKRLLALFMGFVNCRIMVMTMTDLNQFHIKRSINQVHYVYVFHSLVSTHMLYLAGAFDHYDSILCTGPYQVEEIRKYEKLHNLPAKRLVEAGYYRLERIFENFQKYKAEKPALGAGKKSTILIAPSWGPNNVIESCGRQLVKAFLESNYRVIVRPHPETVRRSPEIIRSLADEFGADVDFQMETSVATDESLFDADLLISDLSGIVLEYAFGTERPVLFIDVPPKIRNADYDKLGIEPLELSVRHALGTVINPADLDNVPRAVEKLIVDKDKYKDDIEKLRQKNIFAFGESSKIGAEYIIQLLEKTDCE